ncbi:MAG: dual specificity protein phosphatase family protein [Deltaproteobacteria bacterium]
MPDRFSWVIEDKIAGMERPGLFYDLEEDLDYLWAMGIETIVNLEEEEHFRDYSGFTVKHIPVDDFGAPQLRDFEEFVEFTESEVKNNRRIAVHCYAGMGRTNLMIACFLIHYLKIGPLTALETVKLKRPFYLVTPGQELALMEYFKHVKNRLAIPEYGR